MTINAEKLRGLHRLLDHIDAQTAEIARLRQSFDKLSKAFEASRDGAKDRFRESGNVYHEGRLVAYDQAASYVRTVLRENPSD